MANGILVPVVDFTGIAEDEFNDWYDFEHIPERLQAALQDFDPAYVRFGSAADIAGLLSNVRFTPHSGQSADMLACPLSAESGLMHCSKISAYSIISSACSRDDSEMVEPSAFAVVRLMTRSVFSHTGGLLKRRPAPVSECTSI